MKLLSALTDTAMTRLAGMEAEAKTLSLELDTLEVRLSRAFEAVWIDAIVIHLNTEGKRMLDDEKRTETGASLAGFPALGIYGLFCLFTGKKPNWDKAISETFREEPFGDIRIVIGPDGINIVNVSKLAREQNMDVVGILAYLEAKGNEVLTWSSFEARAKNLRAAVLNGEVTLLGKQEARLQLQPPDSPRFVSGEIRQSG
jgi:hypothetical protein